MSDLTSIKKIGSKTEKALEKLGIFTIEDLFKFYPFRYEVLKLNDINSCEDKEKITVNGVIESVPLLYHFRYKVNKMTFRVNVKNNILAVNIYNRGFLKPHLTLGKEITIIGKYDKLKNSIMASDLKLEAISKEEKIEPIYHLTTGLTSGVLRNYINDILENHINSLESVVPENLRIKYKLLDIKEATKLIHNPSNLDDVKKGEVTLKYEELFSFMLKINYLKYLNTASSEGLEREFDENIINEFIGKLPFKLTEDQLSVTKEILQDLKDKKRMNRLIQGDVGSGKTIVSVISILANYLSGYQSALMAPTEILASQHFDSIRKLLSSTNMKISLLKGNLNKNEKKKIYEDLENGEIDLIIGTHALIQKEVVYKNLGLVVTDEQHRFGVNQRANLKNKGVYPDVLYMSATPIPRTYALTLYGDMAISSIKTRPSGRKDIKTYLKKPTEIKDVLLMMNAELKKGHQIYVVAPLIEESDKISLENAIELKRKMELAFGTYYKLGLMHGKMKSDEKEDVMDSFAKGKTQILISTTVIEVGVDVKNATMIVIYDAYRFGLSALHQLRGRVGRNEFDSYCILISSEEKERLTIMTEINDGFLISEKDFELRGSGDLFGFKQSGDMNFKIANLKKDYKILVSAKDDSEDYLLNELLTYPRKYSSVINRLKNEVDTD